MSERGPALLTVDDAARYLAVTPACVRRWISQRRFPVIKLGPGPRACVRLRALDLDAYVAASVRPASPVWSARTHAWLRLPPAKGGSR
jgi:excisionase family DNA binding protein